MTREELNAVRGYVGNIQAIKDAHNTDKFPINYGTICDITANGWKLIEELKKSDWIPVTERLPKERGEYQVTYHPCYWGRVQEDQWKVGFDSFRGKTEWAKKKYQKVIAWKPKPEPYRG